jgi:hypothetical protein
MVGLEEVQAALNSPGVVTSTPLSFNQLKIQIARKLQIETDDAVFNDHKQAIKDSYVKVFESFCAAVRSWHLAAAQDKKKFKSLRG